MNDDDMNEYEQQGYANRREYLDALADAYGRERVYALAGVLGPAEDFDGLVTALDGPVTALECGEDF